MISDKELHTQIIEFQHKVKRNYVQPIDIDLFPEDKDSGIKVLLSLKAQLVVTLSFIYDRQSAFFMDYERSMCFQSEDLNLSEKDFVNKVIDFIHDTAKQYNEERTRQIVVNLTNRVKEICHFSCTSLEEKAKELIEGEE